MLKFKFGMICCIDSENQKMILRHGDSASSPLIRCLMWFTKIERLEKKYPEEGTSQHIFYKSLLYTSARGRPDYRMPSSW